jgi:hypothetical protein
MFRRPSFFAVQKQCALLIAVGLGRSGGTNVLWLRGGVSMIDNFALISTDRAVGGRYASVQHLEIALNQAIAHTEISASYERYFEIFDAFSADDIAVTGDTLQELPNGRREPPA